MNSFLIIGGVEDKRREKAFEFGQNYQISNFDTLLVEPSATGSIGITEIRSLKAKLNLKPFNSSHKLAVLLNFEKATHEAQNAFLKTLEEPPGQTIIVLTSPNADLLLPTLVSRCQVIHLATSNKQLATSELSILNSQFSILLSDGVGKRLKLAQEVGKTREDVIRWLEKMIIFTRKKLIESVFKNNNNLPLSQYLNLLTSFQKTHTLLSTTNVNPRFSLENLFLNLG